MVSMNLNPSHLAPKVSHTEPQKNNGFFSIPTAIVPTVQFSGTGDGNSVKVLYVGNPEAPGYNYVANKLNEGSEAITKRVDWAFAPSDFHVKLRQEKPDVLIVGSNFGPHLPGETFTTPLFEVQRAISEGRLDPDEVGIVVFTSSSQESLATYFNEAAEAHQATGEAMPEFEYLEYESGRARKRQEVDRRNLANLVDAVRKVDPFPNGKSTSVDCFA